MTYIDSLCEVVLILNAQLSIWKGFPLTYPKGPMPATTPLTIVEKGTDSCVKCLTIVFECLPPLSVL